MKIKKVCIETLGNSNIKFLHGGSDLDESFNQIFENNSDIQDSNRDITKDVIMKNIANYFEICENTG